jgi:predicted AlkP superfamily phosphohydrolase/phosphomutase/tetratricopeptide (TPR) repeat protein
MVPSFISGGPKHKLLLIGWDAADWQIINPLMDSGQMPHLEGLVNRGVIGNLATLYPCLSPILWSTIATGHTADRHGILGFVEPQPDASGVRLSSSTSRKTRALWNIAALRQLRSVVVNWYASHPAEPIPGVCVSNEAFRPPRTHSIDDWKMPPDCVFPPDRTESVANLRLHSSELLPSDIQSMLPGIDRIDHRVDARPAKLREILAKAISIQSVFTAALDAEPWDFAAVFFDAIDVAGHVFMPYYPPRMLNVSEHDYELYHHVMPEMYKFHDQMLGSLLQQVDENTRILLVSDHGFESGSHRPLGPLPFQTWQPQEEDGQASQWHRHYGVVVMAGPGIKQDERIYGATLLDIAPTALALLGLPKGSDMPGRVLVDAFWDERGTGTIESWENELGEDGQHSASAKFDPVSAASEWEVLAQLGYLPKRAEGSQSDIAIMEAEYNLAAVHLHHERPQEALPVLQSLSARFPGTPRFLKALATCFHHLHDPDPALEIIHQLDRAGHMDLDTELMAAKCLGEKGEFDRAHERFQRTISSCPEHAVAWCMWGEFLLDRSDGAAAWDRFREAVERGPELYRAQLGLAKAALMTGRYREALEAAQEASRIHHFSPMAHFHRGVALERLGRSGEARDAYLQAVEQQPNFYQAHDRLAVIHDQSGDFVKAMRHHQAAQDLVRPVDQQQPTASSEWTEWLNDIQEGKVSGFHMLNESVPLADMNLADGDRIVNVVSGLPRSGTSLLMQLLDACGIAPLADTSRLADESNPRGYYEFEPVKSLHIDSSWLEMAVGKVVKVVYPNILELPVGPTYRVFFLMRDLEEVVESQSVMLARGGSDTIINPTRLLTHWRSKIPRDLRAFQQRTGSHIILVPFRDLFQEPVQLANQLQAWLGRAGAPPDLRGIVDPSLHRQRKGSIAR